MSGAFQLPLSKSAARNSLLLLAACLWADVPAAGQTAFSWNIGNGTWDNTALNWDPAGPPGVLDDVFLGDLGVAADAEVTLGLNTPVLNLLDISGGIDLLTGSFQGEALTVSMTGAASNLVAEDGGMFLNNSSTDILNGSLLLVESGGTYFGGQVSLSGSGDLQLTGGSLHIGSIALAGFLHINGAASEVAGWGTVDFADTFGIMNDFLVNEGAIRTCRPVLDPGIARYELIFDTDVNEAEPLVNLDGTTEAGTLSLTNTTTLTILGTLNDAFSSTMSMSPGSILNISQPWEIDSGAVIDIDALQTFPVIPARFARIEGGELTAESGSTINVHSGTLEIDADFDVEAGSLIEVMDNSTLEINGTTLVDDAEAIDLTHDNTTLIVNGHFAIFDAAGQFDWDGTGTDAGHAVTEVNEAAFFIDVGSFDTGAGAYQYDGTLTVNSGTVAVRVNDDDTTPWVMDGELNLANTSGTVAFITDNPLEIGDGAGGVLDATVNVSGTGVSVINTGLTVRSDAVVEIAAGAVLDLREGAELDGGALMLDGGEATGDLIRNGGTIAGNGRVTSTSVNNFGTIEADGGTLVIDTVNASQLDGAAPNNGQGILRASTGNLEVASNVTTVFNGMLEVDFGHTFTMSQPNSRFRNAPASEDDDGSGDFGRVELARGTIVVTNFEQASELTATGSGRSTIEGENIAFESGSLTQIVGFTDQLRLRGNTVIESGATFGGIGFLENDDGSSLILEDGANLGIELVNHGTMSIGSSPGTATVDRFIQGSGTWIVEIGGTAPGTEFDRLVVTNGVSIQGTLEVELIDLGAGLFTPSLGDTFEILVADSVVHGFENASLPVLSAGLFWHVITHPDSVLLAVADHIAGDYNRNGTVDAADYVVWRSSEGSTRDLAADGNLDGTVDDADFSVWRANFGATAASGSRAAVPEPAALVLLSIGAACALGRVRKKPPQR